MTTALVIVSVVALLELLLIVGVCQIAAAERIRRQRAEQLLRTAAQHLSHGTLEAVIRKWLAANGDGGTP